MMARPKGKPRAMKDIRQAVEMYIAGEKMDDIAEKFGVTQPTVSYWMKRHGKSLGHDRYIQSIRKQGRRQDAEPSERDQEIVCKALMGVPAAQIAKNKGITRARASYIFKTWVSRGYRPPVPFKVGQVVTDQPGSPSRFVILEVYGHEGGRVVQTVGLVGKDTFGRLDKPVEYDDFKWYFRGKLCEVVNDTAAG